jgi:hypothetical protein
MKARKWMDDASVQHEILRLCYNREAGVFIGWPDKGLFPVRRLYVPNRETFKSLLKVVDYDRRPVSFFLGSNVIHWKSLNPIPPLPYKLYSPIWKAYKVTWDKFLEKGNKDFYDIWIGKNLIWDFDKADAPLEAFTWADNLCKYLTEKELHPKLIFSGNKGFHVWLEEDESMLLIGKTLSDFKNKKDPLLYFGRHCADIIQSTLEDATGKELEVCDLSPVRRQGLIRTPYSIHPKSGQIVWPLDAQECEKLRGLVKANPKATPAELAECVHAWNSPSENDFKHGEGVTMYHPPFNKVFQRGLPDWG